MPQNIPAWKATWGMHMLEQIASFSELIGALGVIVSVVYVGRQLRVAGAQTVHDNFSGWYSSVQGDPELLALSIKGMKDYARLTEVEKGQFIAMFMAFTSHSQNAFYKLKDGSLSPDLWRCWEFVSMNFLATPGGKAFWDERGYMFSDKYRRHVENVVMQKPHPSAKPWGAFDIGR
jgi:hypothetical protein